MTRPGDETPAEALGLAGAADVLAVRDTLAAAPAARAPAAPVRLDAAGIACLVAGGAAVVAADITAGPVPTDVDDRMLAVASCPAVEAFAGHPAAIDIDDVAYPAAATAGLARSLGD